MYKEILQKLLSFPQKGQIQIKFDLKRKVYRLSAPIFSCQRLPQSIKGYVEARANAHFKPHSTSYKIEGEKVFLIQEISFFMDFQTSSRTDLEEFLTLSRHCHKMFSELAIEESYKDALFHL